VAAVVPWFRLLLLTPLQHELVVGIEKQVICSELAFILARDTSVIAVVVGFCQRQK
jgi:hypothetical protein